MDIFGHLAHITCLTGQFLLHPVTEMIHHSQHAFAGFVHITALSFIHLLKGCMELAHLGLLEFTQLLKKAFHGCRHFT